MLLCLSDAKQPTISKEHIKKLTNFQKLQIANGN